MQESKKFDETSCLHHLRHYLPAQAPLKDFIHHNTLHAFQNEDFHHGIQKASALFGYQVYAPIAEYQQRYQDGQINDDVVNRVTKSKSGINPTSTLNKLFNTKKSEEIHPRIGQLRSYWKKNYHIHMDKAIHPILFRITGSYLDQGVSIWHFPIHERGFLCCVRALEEQAFQHFLQGKRARKLLSQTRLKMETLLEILVGDSTLYEPYLFDQQFAHPGWSGMVATLEEKPDGLLHERRISLHDFICLELLLEIDHLDRVFGENWRPLGQALSHKDFPNVSAPVKIPDTLHLQAIWQDSLEWSFYDQVLQGIRQKPQKMSADKQPSFQAIFCIDDRECSLRRYLEHFAPDCQTYGTAGFFNVAFYYQPGHSHFFTKVCPAPVTPTHLIKETNAQKRHTRDRHFEKHSHSILGGWIVSQTLGIWSAIRLMLNVLRPAPGPAMVSSFDHMDPESELSFENKDPNHREKGLQIGFTIEEMADRVEGLLKTIGLVNFFGSIVYVVGHGASSINNTHYAGYDCGACSGRPGSVNARVVALMANHPEVRKRLSARGIQIPQTTTFVGALHDTTKDEIAFFESDFPENTNKANHENFKKVFHHALSFNARERARRFVLMNPAQPAEKVHKKVKLRAVSLFEPRPELNHATNALCIVGRRSLSSHVFLDRRSFLQSYDYRIDPEGKYLTGIMNAVAPVCGGINLEYYFSRVDNQRLGAGTKLPHNVVGLIGVANGMDGDLRPGLPSQMIEVHDPLRLLVIVEQFPEVVLTAITSQKATERWFFHEWIHLISVNPETGVFYRYTKGTFEEYEPSHWELKRINNIAPVLQSSAESLPVFLIE